MPRLKDPRANLRTQMQRIIARAGETPWPRLFHNLRASCACDWVEQFPAHVAAGWLGHSPLIAAQHYLQARDEHFNLAAGLEAQDSNGEAVQKSGAECGARVAQFAAQHTSATVRTDSHQSIKTPRNTGVLRADANTRESATNKESGRRGIRTPEGIASRFTVCPV